MQGQQQQSNPLQTERGNTNIDSSVVSKVAGIAAQEVDGVRMVGGTTEAVGGILSSVTGSAQGQAQGVSVELFGGAWVPPGTSPVPPPPPPPPPSEATIDLTLSVAYGKPAPQVSEAVRRNVINRVENLTGLNVREVNISVKDLFFLQEEQQEAQTQQELEIVQRQQV